MIGLRCGSSSALPINSPMLTVQPYDKSSKKISTAKPIVWDSLGPASGTTTTASRAHRIWEYHHSGGRRLVPDSVGY